MAAPGVPMPLALLLARVASATVVPGGSIGTTTWDVAGSPWVVQGDVTVLAGATLTIEAGVDVRFSSSDASASGLDTARVELIVDGDLDVAGDPLDPVDFLADVGTSASTWYGLRVNGSATITGATVQHATYGIRSGGTLDGIGVSFDRNGTAGVYVTGGTASLADLSVTGSSYGLWVTGT